jgi:hypothetical protein
MRGLRLWLHIFMFVCLSVLNSMLWVTSIHLYWFRSRSEAVPVLYLQYALQGPSFLESLFTWASLCSHWELMMTVYLSFLTLELLVIFTRLGLSWCWGISTTLCPVPQREQSFASGHVICLTNMWRGVGFLCVEVAVSEISSTFTLL